MRILTLLLTLTMFAASASAQNDVPTADEANALMQAGEFQQAAQAWKKRADVNAFDAQAHFLYAYSLHGAGDLDAAHDAHISAARFAEYTALALYNHACIHALRNEKDAAFTALREAIAAGFNRTEQLQTDSDLENLRSDGRFEALELELQGTKKTDLKVLPPARRFDFYLGSWTMRNGDKLERTLEARSAFDGQGMTISSVNASDGKTNANSMYLYDEDDGLWRQIWMGMDGSSVVLEGGFEGDSMILDQVSQDGRPSSGARAVFTNITTNGFTYLWQQTGDGGRTWETLATRFFTRS